MISEAIIVNCAPTLDDVQNTVKTYSLFSLRLNSLIIKVNRLDKFHKVSSYILKRLLRKLGTKVNGSFTFLRRLEIEGYGVTIFFRPINAIHLINEVRN